MLFYCTESRIQTPALAHEFCMVWLLLSSSASNISPHTVPQHTHTLACTHAHTHIEPHQLLTHTPNIPLPQDLCMCCCIFLEVPLYSLLTTTCAALQVADTCHLSGVRKGLLDHPTVILCFQHNTYHRYLFCLFTCFFSLLSIRPSAP